MIRINRIQADRKRNIEFDHFDGCEQLIPVEEIDVRFSRFIETCNLQTGEQLVSRREFSLEKWPYLLRISALKGHVGGYRFACGLKDELFNVQKNTRWFVCVIAKVQLRAAAVGSSIDIDKKMNSLQKSNRPDWRKLRDVNFDDRILDDYREGMVGAGSTDVSDVSWVTPTIEFTTTCCMLGTPGHSWQFTAQNGMSIGHKGLIFSTKVHASAGLELLTKPELLKKVKEEWVTRLAGRVYKPPIPMDLKPPLDQLKDA